MKVKLKLQTSEGDKKNAVDDDKVDSNSNEIDFYGRLKMKQKTYSWCKDDDYENECSVVNKRKRIE